MLEYVLDHIVTVLITNKLRYKLSDLVVDLPSLNFLAVLKHTLHDATPVRVDAQLVDILKDGLDHEVYRVRRHLLYAFLNHVVSVLVVDTECLHLTSDEKIKKALKVKG